MSRRFASGDQSTGASALASVFPMNIQGLFPLGLTDYPRDPQAYSPAPYIKTLYAIHLKLIQCYISIHLNKAEFKKIERKRKKQIE